MTVKITGFADEIAPELTAQIAGLKGLGMSYVEMRGVDGENLIYHTDEKWRRSRRHWMKMESGFLPWDLPWVKF